LALADRPRALGAAGPLDAGVARVEERGAFGKVSDLERAAKARLLERVVPPQRGLAHRGALGLGHAAVEVIDDRLHRIRERGARILLLEPPAADEGALERLGEGCGVIEERGGEEADAGIERAPGVAGRGQREE